MISAMWMNGEDSPDPESFGARVRRLRMARGLSQSDFAAALSVSTAAVCNWELDRARPKVGRMHAIAALLEVTADKLFGRGTTGPLHEKLAQSREEIARLAGTTPEKVRIIIEI
ncbi:XRE family transcriptional regulator [Sphingopyxis sp. YF1]|jgi:transcriptional regulator with XRE-family HTH domain|nr:XRE family transcriptional regulator [Sphingopyxis sp. YF1]HZG31989.1 helix-turn-helix transcriptional regulator [Sphingopyxis sp.]